MSSVSKEYISGIQLKLLPNCGINYKENTSKISSHVFLNYINTSKTEIKLNQTIVVVMVKMKEEIVCYVSFTIY